MKTLSIIFKTVLILVLFNTSNLFGQDCSIIATLSGGGDICEGELIPLTVSVEGSSKGELATYTIVVTDGINIQAGTRTGSGGIVFVVSESGTWTVQSVSDGNCEVEGSGAAIVNILPTTEIIIQPQDVSSCASNAFCFNVEAVGGNLTYQWYMGSTVIPRATSNAFCLPSATTAYNGDYTVEITGDCDAVVSDVAKLSITDTETPVVTLVADNEVCEGYEVMFIASATNGGVAPEYEFIDLNGRLVLPEQGLDNTLTISSVTTDLDIQVKMISNVECLDTDVPIAVSSFSVDMIEYPVASIITPEVSPKTFVSSLMSEITIEAALAGEGGAGYSINWSIRPTLGIGNAQITDPTQLLTDIKGLEIDNPYTLELIASYNNEGVCPSEVTAIEIELKDITVPLIEQEDICIDQLTDGVTIVGSEVVQGLEVPTIIGLSSGSILNSTGTIFVGTNTLTIPFDTPAGDYTVEYQIYNKILNATLLDTAGFTIYDLPTEADAGVDMVTCIESVVLSANTPTIGTGLWTCDGGMLSDPTNPTSLLSGLIENVSTSCTWTISNGTCSGSSDVVQIERIGDVTTPIIFLDGIDVRAQSVDVCISDIKTIKGGTPLSPFETGQWQIAGTSVVGVDGTDPDHGILTLVSEGLTEISWTISSLVPSCPPQSSYVEINVIDDVLRAEILSVSALDTCEDVDVIIATTELQDGSEGKWVSDIKPLENSGEWIIDSEDLSEGENVVTYEVSNACGSASASEIINIRSRVFVDASSDGINPIILDQFIESFQLTGSHDGVSAFWSFNGELTFDDTTSLTPTVSASKDGRYFATLNTTDGKCTYSDDVEILIGENPTGLNQIISVSDQSNLFIEGLEGYASVLLSVFDLNGKQIEQINLNEDDRWKPENYNLGTYVYRLKYDENKTRSGVFILVD